MKFTDLNLNENIQKALASINFTSPTEVQEKAIPYILEGKDLVVRSETGSGKTFAFALPIIQKIDFTKDCVQCLVICPTRELALQNAEEIKKLSAFLPELKILTVYGGSDMLKQVKGLRKNPKIVIGTPGRLMDHMRRKNLTLENITTIVLDEADEMLDMGFKKDIEFILKDTPKTRQTLMFSATFPNEIMAITKNYMNQPTHIEIGQENKSVNKLIQTFTNVNAKDKKAVLIEFFKTISPKHPIIFTNTKAMSETLTSTLQDAGYNALSLNGDLRQNKRTWVIKQMKENEDTILVATDVAARGIDINDVDYVINYDLPNNVEYFLHRIGRTARIGKDGNAFTIITTKEQLDRFMDFKKRTNSEITEVKIGDFVKTTKEGGEKPDNRRFKHSDDRHGRDFGRRSFNHDRRDGRSFGDRDRKPFDRNRRSFGDRKPFNKENSDVASEEKSFDEKPNFEGRKSFHGERSSFGRRDRRSFGDRDRKPFDRDRKSFGDRDRKPFDRDRKPFDRDRKPFDKSSRPERDPFKKDKYYDKSRKGRAEKLGIPYEDKKPFDRDRKPFDRDRKPFDRDRKSFGDRDRKSFGDRDRKPFNRDRKSFGDRKPFGRSKRPFGHDKKPFVKNNDTL